METEAEAVEMMEKGEEEEEERVVFGPVLSRLLCVLL